MGNCLVRNKIKPKDFDDLGKIGSVHTIRNLSDLKKCVIRFAGKDGNQEKTELSQQRILKTIIRPSKPNPLKV